MVLLPQFSPIAPMLARLLVCATNVAQAIETGPSQSAAGTEVGKTESLPSLPSCVVVSSSTNVLARSVTIAGRGLPEQPLQP